MKLERVQKIYKGMEGLVIALDPNPAARGPQYLQDLISKTRGFLNTTMFYLQEVMQERHGKEMELEAAETDFQIQSDELLANDRRVTMLPAIDDRMAMINVLLSDERRSIQVLKREIKNLGHVEKAVRFRHKELDSSMSAIRLQRSLIETELRTGAFYGDESGTARSWGKAGNQPISDDIDAMADADFQDWDSQLKNVSGDDPEDNESEDEDDDSEDDDSEDAEVNEDDEGEDDSDEDYEGEDDSDEDSDEEDDESAEDKAPEEPKGEAESLLDDLGFGDDVDFEDAVVKEAPKPKPKPKSKKAEPAPDKDNTEPKEAEDPDIEKFLEGDDFSDLFDDL